MSPGYKRVSRMVREDGIEIDGLADPFRDARLREKLRSLTIRAGGGAPYYPRCVPSGQAAEAQAVLDEMASPAPRKNVFVPLSLLEELDEQGVYDSQFGDAFLISDCVIARALEDHGLAARETRGGYHQTDALSTLLRRLEGD